MKLHEDPPAFQVLLPYDEVIDRINSLYDLLLTLDEDLEPQQNEQGFSMNMTM